MTSDRRRRPARWRARSGRLRWLPSGLDRTFVSRVAVSDDRRVTPVEVPDTTVEVVDADPAWPLLFAEEHRRLARALPAAVLIEHVGSTSVAGLAAKPTIDILVVVAPAELPGAIPVLRSLGYQYVPASFADDPDHAFLHRLRRGKRTHHLHLVSAASPLPDRYLLFRDYLRAHPDAAARYESVKRELAARYPTDRDRYVVEKPTVVVELLAEAARWTAHPTERYEQGRR